MTVALHLTNRLAESLPAVYVAGSHVLDNEDNVVSCGKSPPICAQKQIRPLPVNGSADEEKSDRPRRGQCEGFHSRLEEVDIDAIRNDVDPGRFNSTFDIKIPYE